MTDFDAAGLLDDLDGDAREARLALLQELEADLQGLLAAAPARRRLLGVIVIASLVGIANLFVLSVTMWIDGSQALDLAVLFRLNEQGITIVLIEHIMRAVMSFSTRLVVLVAGQKIADGSPQEAIRNPEVERAYLGE